METSLTGGSSIFDYHGASWEPEYDSRVVQYPPDQPIPRPELPQRYTTPFEGDPIAALVAPIVGALQAVLGAEYGKKSNVGSRILRNVVVGIGTRYVSNAIYTAGRNARDFASSLLNPPDSPSSSSPPPRSSSSPYSFSYSALRGTPFRRQGPQGRPGRGRHSLPQQPYTKSRNRLCRRKGRHNWKTCPYKHSRRFN